MANVYHANFKSIEPRPGRRANSIVFCAADDAGAAAVAAELTSWTTGQLASLTGRIAGSGTGGAAYPVGTRRTASAYVIGSDGGVWRIRFRNVGPTVNENDITNLLLGTVGTSGVGATLTALGSAPTIPGTGVTVVAVSGVSISTRP